MAHRGYFNHQNIPSDLGFIQGYIFDRINPEKLVQAAVNDRLLPVGTIDVTSVQPEISWNPSCQPISTNWKLLSLFKTGKK